MRNLKYFPLLVLLFALLTSCHSNHRPGREIPTGLVLGGGGAKSAAEIGVLEVIDSLGIHIDYIAGSSMGAVVGGLYAAGYSAKEIRDMWLNEDWLRVFDQNSLFTFEGNNRTIFGVFDGDAFEGKLRNVLSKKKCRTFADTRIPFVCTATRIVDETSIEEVRLGGKGVKMDLASAIRASMTYPAPLVGHRPYEFEGMRLADGGMTNNLPVDVVDSMGAKRIIAVDLEMMDHSDEQPLPWLNTLARLFDERVQLVEDITDTGWLIEWKLNRPDCKKRNANRKFPHLIYIHPEQLDMYNILSFSREDAEKMMFFGRFKAQNLLKDIKHNKKKSRKKRKK